MIGTHNINKILFLYHHKGCWPSQIARDIPCSTSTVDKVIGRYKPVPCNECGQPIRKDFESKNGNSIKLFIDKNGQTELPWNEWEGIKISEEGVHTPRGIVKPQELAGLIWKAGFYDRFNRNPMDQIMGKNDD